MNIINVGNRIVNVYVYRAPIGLVMIDTGYENGLKRVEKKLASYNLSMAEIKYVFLTHAHDDHAGFLNELLKNYPDIRVFINPASLPVLKRGQNRFEGGCSSVLAFWFCKAMALAGKGQHRFPPIEDAFLDRLIHITPETKERIGKDLGGKILFTPGHTNDSISLNVDGHVFCGDAAMNGFPSMNRITIWVEDTREFQTSWELLIAQDAKMLLPSHGSPFPKSDLERYIHVISKIHLRKLRPAGKSVRSDRRTVGCRNNMTE